METFQTVPDGSVMHTVDVPVTVVGGRLELHMTNQMITGFALLDQHYKEKEMMRDELKLETEQKQKVCSSWCLEVESMHENLMIINNYADKLRNNVSITHTACDVCCSSQMRFNL